MTDTTARQQPPGSSGLYLVPSVDNKFITELDIYQGKVVDLAKGRTPVDVPSLLFYATELGEEAGEVLGKIKKYYRDDDRVAQPMSHIRRKAIEFELGDVLFSVAKIASLLNLPLSVVANNNIIKLTSRHERGVVGGEGDYR